jgi:polar amino acid transport system substrate-binding protein
MPKAMPVLAVLLATACALATAATPAPRLYIATETSAPLSMRDGNKVTGSATAKVREIMRRTGITYTIELLPWKRAYTSAQERGDGCVFSTTRTPERERQFKWIGPTDEAEWVLMGRTDRDLRLRTLDEARGLRIGTYNGDARDQFLRERGFQVDSAQNDMINPRKLLLGRIDLWAASLRRSSAVLRHNGWAGDIVPLLTFARVQLYLACNPAVPDALVARMNAALAEMGRDGSIRRIDREYQRWPEQAN